MIKPIKLILLTCFLFWQSISISQNIYVATDGNDSNDGSINAPFKTFAKAVSVMSAGDTCIIKGGVYDESLNINKNGTTGNYLTFKAADGDKVEIKATSKINGWELHEGNIYKTTVNMSIETRFRAIYHNGDYMDLARWPNNTDNNRWTVDCTPATGGTAGSSITGTGIPNYDWENGGLIYYLGAHSGTSWTRPITSSTSTTIGHTQVDINKWPFSVHNVGVWRNNPNNERGQFFLFNKLEALDHAREWYYDSTTSTLYFQAPDGNIPEDGAVEYATKKYLAEITGDYVILDGLEFFGGSVKIHNNADNNQIINCKIIHGVECYDELDNTDAQMADSSLEILGENTLVKGCTIDHSAANGISIHKWAGAHNCIVEGNYISNIDYLGIHTKPISTGAQNIKVLKNTITNSGRDGITVGGLNSEIAYNDISHSQLINSDSGIFYVVGNTELKNVELHHNWFHDATAPAYSHNPNNPAKAAGIYLDNDSKGYLVHHNVVWNVSWSGYQVNWNNTDLDFFHNTIWNAERAMDSWDINGPQQNNKVYNNYANTGSWFTGNGPAEFDIQDSPIFSGSPLEDPDNLNFMPKVGSELIDQAQIISGFDKPYKGGAPDIGAYERLGTQWTAGVNAIEDTGEGAVVSVLDTQFTISVTSETCPDQDNGTLNIDASAEADYELSFNGADYSFFKDQSLTDIIPGEYEICLTIKDSPEQQCFIVEVGEANEITSKTSLNKKELEVVVTNGTAPYKVFVNDTKIFETMSTAFEVAVSHGDTVKVISDKDCEGELIESIDFYSNIQPYPNPTSGQFQITLPINEGRIPIEIYDIRSQLISSKVYKVNSGNVDLDLSSRPSGLYFVKLVLDQPLNIKIVKK